MKGQGKLPQIIFVLGAHHDTSCTRGKPETWLLRGGWELEGESRSHNSGRCWGSTWQGWKDLPRLGNALRGRLRVALAETRNSGFETPMPTHWEINHLPQSMFLEGKQWDPLSQKCRYWSKMTICKKKQDSAMHNEQTEPNQPRDRFFRQGW